MAAIQTYPTGEEVTAFLDSLDQIDQTALEQLVTRTWGSNS